MHHFININLREIVPFINWTYFFRAWKMSGRYDGIETANDSCKADWLYQFPEAERAKAEEALKLFCDAQEMLRRFLDEKTVQANAVFGIFPAYAAQNDIIICNNKQKIIIPTLRQQQPSGDGFCYSLADFLAEKDDFIGIFACTMLGAEKDAKKYEQNGDLYSSFLVQTLADRLAEAVSEWLHFQVRKNFWAYNPDEVLDVEQILKKQYPGIRPAVGYPSLPDQSIIFELDTVLKLNKIGIKLTENGAMIPAASVCGLYFSHPKSKYFIVGEIDRCQFADYASRRGKTVDEMKKWLPFIGNSDIFCTFVR